MGSILASTLIDKVANQVLDKVGAEFSRTELLAWLNDGQRQVVVMAPNANNVTEAKLMSAGSRQTLPSGGWLLLDVYRNMGTDGSTPGRAVRVVSKKLMDSFDPDWHVADDTTEVEHFVYDPQDQKAFWVSPPSDGTGYIQINYSKAPTDVAAEGSAITLDDIYAPALLDYMMYRALQKADTGSARQQEAGGYWQQFATFVTGKTGIEALFNPNQSLDVRRADTPGAES